ncbi:MAG: hypothetical protein R3267_12095 [Paenisporosarcina sp.]|nr:hypothetical protein [Paenisporosarcina sp.]
MTNKQNVNQQEDQMTKGIKDKAGATFHAVHNALEKTEFAAMNTVDKTAKAVNGLTNKNSNSPANSKKSSESQN